MCAASAPSRRHLLTAGLAAAAAAILTGPRRAAAAAGPFAEAAAHSAARRGVSLLVLRDGETLFEDYPNEGGAARGWELASGTKSFCGILAAAGVADGWLSLDEPCAETLAEWRGTDKAAITVRHLLTLTSGLGGGPLGRPPPYREAIAAPLVAPPGTRFAYGPTPFQVFGEVVRRRQGDPLALMQRRLFDPLEIRPTFWRRGADGNPHLPSGAHLTARDWGRFGVAVGAERLGRARPLGLDAAALAACFTPTAANPGYGLTWWLARPGLIGPGPRSGVDGTFGAAIAGEDLAMAAGAGNQRLYLLRKRGLVVVRQATGVLEALFGRGPAWRDADFLAALLAGL